jgi:hypothetical protein
VFPAGIDFLATYFDVLLVVIELPDWRKGVLCHTPKVIVFDIVGVDDRDGVGIQTETPERREFSLNNIKIIAGAELVNRALHRLAVLAHPEKASIRKERVALYQPAREIRRWVRNNMELFYLPIKTPSNILVVLRRAIREDSHFMLL